MKVIKEGREQKGWAEEYTCTGGGNEGSGCRSLLLVEQDDLYQTTSQCRDETDYHVTFQCCVCGVQTDIGGVPYSIARTLKTDNHRGAVTTKEDSL